MRTRRRRLFRLSESSIKKTISDKTFFAHFRKSSNTFLFAIYITHSWGNNRRVEFQKVESHVFHKIESLKRLKIVLI